MLPKSRHAGQTTLGATEGDRSSSAGAELVLRWLFPATAGPVTSLSPARTILGRGDDCGTALPGGEISRYHAEICRDGPIAILRDLGSRNGSFVNGVSVRESPLGAGDVVRLGEWVGVVVETVRSPSVSFVFGTIAPGLFGGPVLRNVVDPALRAAKSDLSIVIEGETGTGKEVVARAVHALSERQGPFLAVNCAALPEGLAEAELFGYRRGAFTGAERASSGHFRAAQGGTLFLDEITDLPLALQAKILRSLEQREVLPLGESLPVAVDARIVVAAQGSLEKAVADKALRADLFARLDGVTVRLPALRERIEDVPYLFARILHDASGGRPPAVDPRLVERLCLYDWPLNVRELVTLVRRLLVVRGDAQVLKLRDLPSRMVGPDGRSSADARDGPAGPSPDGDSSTRATRDEEDFARLLSSLRNHAGNVSRAAAAIGISRQRAYRLVNARPDLNLDDLRASEEKGEAS